MTIHSWFFFLRVVLLTLRPNKKNTTVTAAAAAAADWNIICYTTERESKYTLCFQCTYRYTMTNRYLSLGIIDKCAQNTHTLARFLSFPPPLRPAHKADYCIVCPFSRTHSHTHNEHRQWNEHLLQELARICEFGDFLYDFRIVETFGKTACDDTGHLLTDRSWCNFAPVLEQLFNIIPVEAWDRQKKSNKRRKKHKNTIH